MNMRRRELGTGGTYGGFGNARRDGGAYVVEVCPRTVFKFVVPTTGGDSIIPLVEDIPAYDWVSGILAVRVHQVTSFPSTTMKVNVTNVSRTDDDPSIVFMAASAATAVTFTGSAAPTAQRLYVAQLATPIGPMVGVGFSVSSFTGGGAIELAVSIELVGRNA